MIRLLNARGGRVCGCVLFLALRGKVVGWTQLIEMTLRLISCVHGHRSGELIM
jgi:hypothetical protein